MLVSPLSRSLFAPCGTPHLAERHSLCQDQNMTDDQGSSPLAGVHRTAVGAAVTRASHLLRDGEPKILRDEFALPLSGISQEEAEARWAAFPHHTSAGWVLRSRYAEDRLAAVRRRLSQYVILGAGLDSYALRHAADLHDLTIFEVDDPPMQVWKQARLKALGLEVPSQLRFAPCDFERSSISDALAAAGFAPGTPAFISWLGVTQYLSPFSINDTLCWAAGCAPGSEIVLTFVVPGPEAERERALLATRMNVDFATFFTPDQMTDVLRKAGFRQIEHFPPEQADSVYFQGRNDGLRAPTLERLVSATVG
jgi:methyltransferase (TIGR00027 family)